MQPALREHAIARPTLVDSLHYAIHALEGGVVLWLSDAGAEHLAMAWVQAGEGALTADGSAATPLDLAVRQPRRIRGPGLDWRAQADGSALLIGSASLAEAALLARIDDLLIRHGASPLPAGVAIAGREALHRVALLQSTRSHRLQFERCDGGRVVDREVWISPVAGAWRTHWAW